MTKRIEFASTTRLDLFEDELPQIVRSLATIMKEPEDTEEDWIEYCFISDESRVVEFLYEEAELLKLRALLDLPSLAKDDLFVDVAEALHRRRSGEHVD
jgi:hypothetical protein